MISISSPSLDLYGSLINHRGYAKNNGSSRRSKRVPTLDGSVVVLDGGFCYGDTTYVVEMPDVLGGAYETLSRMLTLYSSAILSCSEGCYWVYLSSLTLDGLNTRVNANIIQEM